MKRWFNDGINEYLLNEESVDTSNYILGRLNKVSQVELDSLRISKDDLVNYYFNNSFNDTCEYFNIKKKNLRNLLTFYNIKKPKNKVVHINTRTHESYILGGVKSAETLKKNWLGKSEDEKEAWRLKQKEAHSSEEFKTLISNINKEHRKNTSKDVESERNKRRSNSCKSWWYDNFTEDERKLWIKRSLEHGAGWNHKKIKGNDSKPNLAFAKLLEDNNIEYEREFSLGKYSYDFKVGDNLIEINPSATHNSTWGIFNREGLPKDYHYLKSKKARDNNYRCIHVFDWDNIDSIISLLKPRDIIYARKCTIGLVDRYIANNFINKYHIQGDTKYNVNDIRIGLFYDDKLISIMTFGKPRYNKNFEYELLRYCSSYKVIGGAKKIFKYFIKNFSPKSIISYCDLSKFSGQVYLDLGFTYKNYSIGKHWFNLETCKHITDNLLRQRGFDQLFNTDYGKGTSNEDLMLENNFIEIYDAGQAVYILK